jgi:hypothetical protein
MSSNDSAQQWDATRERLQEQADREYGQAWIPQAEGDEIAGVITAIRPVVHTTYGAVPVVELEEIGVRASWSIWLVHTVLRREFVRQRPTVGEVILIRYLGKVSPDGGGAAYESYRLVVDRPDQNDVDWTAIAEKYDPDLASEPVPPATDDESVPF